MKSALLLLSGLAATCLSAAVPVPQPDALLPREKGTVTVITHRPAVICFLHGNRFSGKRTLAPDSNNH